MADMREPLARHWNGKWGRIARRRVELDRTDDGYQVTAKEGDDEKGKQRVWVFPTEELARLRVDSLVEKTPGDPLSEGWREIPIDLIRRPASADQAAEQR